MLKCENCDLCYEATTVKVCSRGASYPDILLVGEAPGKQEDKQGVPFVGEAGQLLDEIIEKAELSKDVSLRWTNVVRCIPWNEGMDGVQKPSMEQIEACMPYLISEIVRRKPKVIMPLGGTPLKALTGLKGVKKSRGVARRETYKNRIGEHSVFVVPTWHPAYILRGNEAAMPEIVQDLKYAAQIIGEGSQDDEDVDYRVINNLEDLAEFAGFLIDGYECGDFPYISVDLETDSFGPDPNVALLPFHPDQYILSIQISWEPYKAVFIPVGHSESGFTGRMESDALVALLKSILTVIPVCGQNFFFDYKTLYTKLGIKCRKVAFDTRYAHFFIHGGSLPNDLDYMASKYLNKTGYKAEFNALISKQPEGEQRFGCVPLDDLVLYACRDADYTLRLASVFTDELIEVERWDIYKTLCLDVYESVVWMEINGIDIDLDKHHELSIKLPQQMQGAIDQVKNSDFYEAWQGEQEAVEVKVRFEVKSTDERSKLQDRLDKDFYRTFDYYNGINRVTMDDGHDLNECTYERNFVRGNQVTAVLLGPAQINIGSWQQLDCLLYDVMRFPDFSGERGTAAEKLRKLGEWAYRKGLKIHLAVIKAILQYRKIAKLKSSYVDNIPGFMYQKQIGGFKQRNVKLPFRNYNVDCGDYRVHAMFNLDGARTGRMSAQDPPLQTIPWQSEIKDMFVSRFLRGLLFHGDFSQMELRVLACLAKDEGFINVLTGKSERFRRYKGDLHLYAASRVFKKPPEEIEKSERRNAKKVNFGLIYGGGPATIAMDTDMSVDEAADLIDGYFRAFPKIKDFIDYQHEFAKRFGYVVSPMGRYHPLPEAKSDDDIKLGHAMNCAINYPIQGGASDIALYALGMVYCRLRRMRCKTVVFASVHDALVNDLYPPEIFRVHKMMVHQMTTAPLKRFKWITVPLKVDFEIGVNWGTMMECSLDHDKRTITLEGVESYYPGIRDNLSQHFHMEEFDHRVIERIEVKKEEKGSGLEVSRGKEFKQDYNIIKVTLHLPSMKWRVKD